MGEKEEMYGFDNEAEMDEAVYVSEAGIVKEDVFAGDWDDDGGVGSWSDEDDGGVSAWSVEDDFGEDDGGVSAWSEEDSGDVLWSDAGDLVGDEDFNGRVGEDISSDDDGVSGDISEVLEGGVKSRVGGVLNIDSSRFSLRYGVVDFNDITFSKPLQDFRSETFRGLSQSVSELGIVVPIHVVETEGFRDHLNLGGSEDDYVGFKYVLLDGMRRVFAGTKNHLGRCHAIIWSFEDSEEGRDASVTLSLILNKFQSHSWSEIWGMFQVLEMSDVVSPTVLEYLLQLEPGDAMKLKDVMLSGYEDAKVPLLDGTKGLGQVYNILQRLRRDEDQLALDDVRGVSVTEGGSVIASEASSVMMSDAEVREALDMASGDDVELTDENFSEWSGEDVPVRRQDRSEGDRIDENLRLSILERDRYTCRVSGFGRGLPNHLTRGLLQVHHIVPVSLSGFDSEENLITLSRDVHALLHKIIDQGGKLGMTKSTYSELDDETKEMYKKLMKLVNVALKVKEQLNLKAEDMPVENEVFGNLAYFDM